MVAPPGQRHTVLLVVDPFLPAGVSDAEHRAPENLTTEGARMNHRSNVRDGEAVVAAQAERRGVFEAEVKSLQRELDKLSPKEASVDRDHA